MLSTTPIRGLRTPGYLIMATMIAMPFFELGIRSSPFRIHSPTWRIGFLGGAAAALITPLFALYIVLVIAAVADDRITEYLVAFFAAIGAILCLGAGALFSLDVLQMKGQISPFASSQYDMGAAWIIARLILIAALFVVVAMVSLRIARSSPRTPATSAGRAGGRMLIRTTQPTNPTGLPAQRGADVDGL